jgi:hypothetical protein
MGVAEKATQTLSPANGDAGIRRHSVDQFVAEPLMIAFAVVVDHDLRERMPQVPLTDRDETIQALFFDRPDESLRMRVAIRRAKRSLDHSHT